MFAATHSLTALILFAFCASAAQAEWGHLTGRFIYDGPAPETKFISTKGKDKPACAENILDESLLVDKKTGGVANVVVFLRTKDVMVHPDYEATAKSDVPVAMEECRYKPHIVLMQTGQSLLWTNNDRIGHNPNFQPPAGLGNSTLFGPGRSSPSTRYQLSQNFPQPMTCNIHPWMRAYVVCRDNPYMAVTKPEGSFDIKLLPAGEFEFQFWHEKTNFLVAKPAWLKGRAKLTIKAGETTDLGDIKLDPKLFSTSEK